jgi:hypothetical protein
MVSVGGGSEVRRQPDAQSGEIVCFGDYTLRDRNCAEMHQPVFDVVDSKLIRRPDKILYQCSATAICARPKRVCAERSPEQSGAVRQ